MWVSGRRAAELLARVLPTREHARLVLRAGLAGQALRTSSALLYDETLVRALADRAPVTTDGLAEICPSGLYVARLARQAHVEVNDPWLTRADVVATQPRMP